MIETDPACCRDPRRADADGTLRCFLVAEDHLWIVTSYHLCLVCHRVWADDEENGWSQLAFEKLRSPSIWVAGVTGVYPEPQLRDVETFARWVERLRTPLHTCPMV